MIDFSNTKLLDEPPLIVLRPLVKVLGSMDKAIFTQQLHYLLVIYKDDPAHQRDGRVWVWNSYKQWEKHFDIWSFSTVKRIIGDLEEVKIILTTDEYNRSKSDCTKWYTIKYDTLEALLNPATALLSLNTPVAQIEQPALPILGKDMIPENPQRNPTKITTTGDVAYFRIRYPELNRFALGLWGEIWRKMGDDQKEKFVVFIRDGSDDLLRLAMNIAADAEIKNFSYVNGIIRKLDEQAARERALYKPAVNGTEGVEMWMSYCGVEIPAVDHWKHKQECQVCKDESARIVAEAAGEAMKQLKGQK